MDFQAGGGTHCNGITAVQNAANFVSVQTHRALTGSKTYAIVVKEGQGLIVPARGKWGNKTASVAT